MSFSMSLQVEPRYFHTAVGYDDYMAVVGGFTQYRNSSEKILIYKYRCNYWYTLDLSGKLESTQKVSGTWSGGYKTLFMLNSAELEIYPAVKC